MATMTSMHTGQMAECIDNCSRCHASCVEMISHCLKKGGKHAEPAHIRILQDCAQICATSADFMLRNSDLHGSTCGVCAEACFLSAESCEAIADDDMLRECAEMCRQCAESCRKMSQAA